MTTGQVYKIPLQSAEAAPGQFVYGDNGSSMVIGFINDVDKYSSEIEICLFESMEIPENSTLITASLDQQECVKMLAITLIKNPNMKNSWMELVNRSIPEDDAGIV